MRKKIILCFLCFSLAGFLCAQEDVWDIDSIFDEANEEMPETDDNALLNELRNKIVLEAAYNFVGGFSPGWNESPWYKGDKEYDYILGAKIDAHLSLDLPISKSLRVHTAFYFSLPDDPVFSIKEFYFDYSFRDIVFVKGGLYEINWGISRFYPFTNLPALVPANRDNWGDSYIIKMSVPRGIGGFDFIMMTRGGFMDNKTAPLLEEFAYGMKYNLALEFLDLDAGILYYRDLPIRLFVSLKTTLWGIELYSEGLAAFSFDSGFSFRASGNIGFLRDFFKNKLTLYAELYYNGESNVAWWRPKTELLEESQVDLYEGFNAALAFIVRPGVLGMRIFGQALYTYKEQSVWLVPGVSIKPGNITVSLSVPMALGKRTDTGDRTNYYRNNTDQRNRPFSVLLGIGYSGKKKYTF